MWKYLNPLNWLDWLGTIKSILDIATKIYNNIMDLITKKKQKEEIDELKKAVSDAKNAVSPEEKARAACAIEKSFNPDSTCDSGPGKQ